MSVDVVEPFNFSSILINEERKNKKESKNEKSEGRKEGKKEEGELLTHNREAWKVNKE
jgi:hypothetical protein